MSQSQQAHPGSQEYIETNNQSDEITDQEMQEIAGGGPKALKEIVKVQARNYTEKGIDSLLDFLDGIF